MVEHNSEFGETLMLSYIRDAIINKCTILEIFVSQRVGCGSNSEDFHVFFEFRTLSVIYNSKLPDDFATFPGMKYELHLSPSFILKPYQIPIKKMD